MENVLLVINIVLAALLVLLVLIQKSEGGALGIGVSQESFMFSRSAGNFLTKATSIVAALFIISVVAIVTMRMVKRIQNKLKSAAYSEIELAIKSLRPVV